MRRASSRRSLVSLLTLAACTACGGSDETTGPRPSTCSTIAPRGTMTAQVSGSAFTADFSTQATYQNSTALGPNIVQVSGVGCIDGTATRTRQILITIGRLTPITPGTYQLSAASQGQPPGSGYSGIASYVSAPNLWYSNIGAGNGTVTFTTVSATRLAGTFAIVAAPTASNTAGNQTAVTITTGSFDIPVP